MKQYELAVGLREEGNVAAAYQTLFKALEIDPDNAKAHLLLGNMFLLGLDDDPANVERAEHHFREVLRIQGSDRKSAEHGLRPDAHNGLGVLYIHVGRYEDAIVQLNKAAEDLFNRQAYMAYGNLGWAYEELGQPDKAIDALLRSVKLHPRFCVGYYRLGKVYKEKQEHELAEQALTSALEADERCDVFQDAWHLRGETRMNLGHREDARADFERCVELQPNTDAGKACARYLEATY